MKNKMRMRALGALIAAMALLVPSAVMAQKPKAKPGPRPSVLRVVPHANLVLLDPTWTSIYITRNYGYLVYDTLFSMDASGQPRPQMVDTWTESEDHLTWTFKLRDGLKWSDGADVTAEDCIASLQRWSKHSGLGQILFYYIDNLSAADPKTIVMKLKTPYPWVLQSLAQLSSYVPFMLPKRAAETPADQQITDHIGSGPFILKQDEFVPGKKAVFVKNPAYVPRSEPPSLAAGGKMAKVDRVDWVSYPSESKAVNALIAGKVDYMEEVSPRYVRRLQRHKGIVIGRSGVFVAMARFNHTIPPFNNPGVRRAVMMAMDQTDYMKSAIVVKKYWKTCYSVFPCGSPLANEAGSEFLKTATMAKAKAALKEAGYDGTPVVLLNAKDIPVIASINKVTVAKLRRLGMKVELRDTTWAEMATERTKRTGWNLFQTYWAAADLESPRHIAFSGDPVNGWYGWPDDKELEALRDQFVKEANPVEQKKIAEKIQERIWTDGATAYLGQFELPVAYRSYVKGVIISPVQLFWNISIER